METVIKTFGVQPILLLAQIVNFLILLFILRKFMYGPLLKILDQRRKKISDGLKNAEQIEKRLLALEEEREKRIKEAISESKKIVNDASKNATQILEDAHKKAQENIENLLAKNEQSMQRERETLRKEIRSELADLVVLGLEKVAKKTLTTKDQKDIVKETLSDIT